MRYVFKFAALLGTCTLLTHCGYLGGEALSALLGTPAFEYGLAFDLASLALGFICVILRWQEKHTAAFWLGIAIDVSISVITVAYLVGLQHYFEDGGRISPIWSGCVGVLAFLATLHAFLELKKAWCELGETLSEPVAKSPHESQLADQDTYI